MTFFSKGRKKKLGLIFDVGSGSVAGAIVEIDEKDNPKAFYAKRASLKISPNLSAERLQSEIIAALGEVSENLIKNGLKALKLSGRSHNDLEFCHAFLSSPWYISDIEILKIKKAEAFKIEKETFEKIISREEESFDEMDSGKTVFERKILGIKINGHKTNNPYGKKAKSLELSIFMGQAEEDFLNKAREEILQHFSLEKIEFHSFMTAFFSTMRDMYKETKDFVLVDITSEITDLALCKDGAIYDSFSFPKGNNFLLRKITEEFDTPTKESLSSLKAFLKSGEKEDHGKMGLLLREAKKEFLRDFSKALNEFHKDFSVPRDIFISTDEDFSEWFSKVISAEEFIQGGIAGEKFRLTVLNQGMLNPHLSKVRGYSKDIFLSIEAIFINKIS